MIRFAQYHMQLMTPAHDRRMNIGAKGLSGEGYKGHTFWDTEIFLLPYFIFTMPEVARSLEEYRYLSLPGAHAKAAQGGFKGAQFPWESAWLDDGEVTPEFLGTDILTGLPTKVWSGLIEIHITADVAFGVWQYYICTGDQEFMDRYGYEIILDCAKFWLSRLETGEDGLLHMNDVVGPDEFKEHVNDNAFTNYMARWNIGKAIEDREYLKAEKPALYAALNEKLGLRMVGGKLRIDPKLPKAWNRLCYSFMWQGQRISVEVTDKAVTVTNETRTAPVEAEICGEMKTFTDSVTVPRA